MYIISDLNVTFSRSNLTQKMSLQFDVDLDYFAEHCENFTGADFKALLYNAQLEVIQQGKRTRTV
jgi:ATP-dependent 26S proteasome regulatory subunit